MPKFVSTNRIIVPDVKFQDNDGKWLHNNEFPNNEQVKAHITYATTGQQTKYMKSYVSTKRDIKEDDNMDIHTDYDHDAALTEHVHKLENLYDGEGKPIKNGKDLVAWNEPKANPLKLDLFYRIMGLRTDDEKGDDGAGEFTKGEE